MANTITIEVELDDGGAVKSLETLEKSTKKQGKKIADNIEKPAKKSLSSVKKSTKPVSQSFAELSKNTTKNSAAFSFLSRSINPVTVGLAAAATAAIGVSRAISAAVIQEQAVERLNQQLKLTGDFSVQSSSDLQDYASSLQQVSEFGDEAIINQIALAKSFGATNEQAKQVASTAIDVAKSFGISLESATRNVSKTLGGYAGELGEVIPELKNLTTQQLQAGAGIDLISNKFNGAGKNLTNYGFVTQQASNAFGDFLEGIGQFITENPLAISAIKTSTETLTVFATAAKDAARFTNQLFGGEDKSGQLEKVNKLLTEEIDLQNKLRDAIAKAERSRRGLDDETRARLEKRIKDSESIEKGLLRRRQTIIDEAAKTEQQKEDERRTERESKRQEELNKQLNQLGTLGLTKLEALDFQQAQELAKLQKASDDKIIQQQEFDARRLEVERAFEEQRLELRRQVDEQRIESSGSVAEAIALSAKNQKASLIDLGKTVTQVSVQGFGNAFQNIGRALATGENASQAFVDTVKNTVGDLASSFGDYYIARGVAASADPLQGGPAVGGPLLAAGVGLKVLSGILGATASSGSGGTATPVQNVGGGFELDNDPVAVAEPEQEQPVTNQITVQGDVFDSEETGLRIFDIISQQSEKNGNVIIGGAFA